MEIIELKKCINRKIFNSVDGLSIREKDRRQNQ